MVAFTLSSSDFALAGEDGAFKPFPGEWVVSVGSLARAVSIV